MTTPTTESLHIRHCDFDAKVKVGGSGPPMVYLHTAGGPRWDLFLDALAERHTVYAPDHPGLGETARDAIHAVDSLWDLVLIYDELLEGLGLSAVPLVGSSFGGMVACELAAHRPERVSRMVLIDPIGLWRDDTPVTPYMMLSQEELVPTLFSNLDAAPVREFLAQPADQHEWAVAQADMIWALARPGNSYGRSQTRA